MKQNTIIILIIIISTFLLSLTIDNYIVVHGEKYYKCSSTIEIDTIVNPGGIYITKIQTIHYDHFKCK